MTLIIGNNEQSIETKNITITVSNVDFEIRVNHNGELAISKWLHGEGNPNIIIMPSATNQIRLK